MLEIKCEKCRDFVCDYQKDGSGHLKRLYADRILKPAINWKENNKLICKRCGRWLGIAVISSKAVGKKSLYPSEPRKCFILFQDSVIKKIKGL